MTGPAFPALPQTSSMRATDGFGDDAAVAALSHRSQGGDPPPPASIPLRSPKASPGGSRGGARQALAELSPTERPDGAGGDRSARTGSKKSGRQEKGKGPGVPRAPVAPADGAEDGDADKLSSTKIAKLRKRFAKASVDLNVELDPTGRFTRSNQVLGKGSSKVVYKGFDRHEGMEIAWNQVKIPGNLSPRARARLMNEIEVLKRLKHKSIMKFYSSWIDTQNNHLNFITEYFHPGPLRRHRRAHKCMPRNVLKRWAWQILQGLVYLHGHQPPIIHRDLKCDNIFIHGVSGEVKIGDLGLAKLMEEGLSTCQSVLGTPEFMAPELYHGIYNEKVDIYAYGMCMLELVTMQFPYMECKNRAQIFRHVSMGIHPASLKKIEDRECQEFIELCINHFHERRPQARQLVKHSFFDDIRNDGQRSGPLQTHLALKKNSGVPKPPQMPKKAKAKRTFELNNKGVTPHTQKLELELNMVSGNGAAKLFMFQFDLDTDTVDTVAIELQEEFGLTDDETLEFTTLLANVIENRIEEERRDTMTHIRASLGPLEDFVPKMQEEPIVDDEEDSAASSDNDGDESGEENQPPDWPSGTRQQEERRQENSAALPPFATDSAMSPTMRDMNARGEVEAYPSDQYQHPERGPFSPQHVERHPYSDNNDQYDPYQRAGVGEERGQSGYRYENNMYNNGFDQQVHNNPFRPQHSPEYVDGMEEKNFPVFDESPQGGAGYVASGHYGGEGQYGYAHGNAAPGTQFMDRRLPSMNTPNPATGAGRPYRDLGVATRGIERKPSWVEACTACTAATATATAAWCASTWGSIKTSLPWSEGQRDPSPVGMWQPRGMVAPDAGLPSSRFRKTGSAVGPLGPMSKVYKKQKSRRHYA